MDRWVGKVAIVTGASSEIGAAIAEDLVRSGIKVVGLARRVERIQELAVKLKGEKGQLYSIECDLRKENDILKAFQWVEKELGGVDILVINAGIASNEPIIESQTETFRSIIEVNVLALAISVREAVKSMRKRDATGHVIVINSVLGHNAEIVTQPISLYAASKYAVTGMVASLQNEISAAKLSIKVTSVSPGLVDTEMPVSIGLPKHLVDSPISIKAKDVADSVLYVLATPLNVQVKELTIEALTKFSVNEISLKRTKQ